MWISMTLATLGWTEQRPLQSILKHACSWRWLNFFIAIQAAALQESCILLTQPHIYKTQHWDSIRVYCDRRPIHWCPYQHYFFQKSNLCDCDADIIMNARSAIQARVVRQHHVVGHGWGTCWWCTMLRSPWGSTESLWNLRGLHVCGPHDAPAKRLWILQYWRRYDRWSPRRLLWKQLPAGH